MPKSIKKIKCYLKTIWEFDTFLKAIINFGAIYVAHNYIEVSNKYIKSRGRIEQKLRCKVCGDVSIAWRKI